MSKPRNDVATPVAKFCLSLESYRRTPEGRVRSSAEFLKTFFPVDSKGAADFVFRFMPNEVRAPVLHAWGIRGAKAALRDNDEKVLAVVHDALLAGDIEHPAFEEGLLPEVLVSWVPLSNWWAFWRAGRLSKKPILKALATAYELGLFDAKWFLENIASKDGSVRGTDVLSEGLAKEDLVRWVRAIRESQDGSPRGIVAALGWETIVEKTTDAVLISALDALSSKLGLVDPPKEESKVATAEATPPKADVTQKDVSTAEEAEEEVAAHPNAPTRAPERADARPTDPPQTVDGAKVDALPPKESTGKRPSSAKMRASDIKGSWQPGSLKEDAANEWPSSPPAPRASDRKQSFPPIPVPTEAIASDGPTEARDPFRMSDAPGDDIVVDDDFDGVELTQPVRLEPHTPMAQKAKRTDPPKGLRK